MECAVKSNPFLRLMSFAAVILLGACDPTPPLSAVQRANPLYEVIDARPACDYLRQRLRDPAITLEGFDAAYRESIKSGCLIRHA